MTIRTRRILCLLVTGLAVWMLAGCQPAATRTPQIVATIALPVVAQPGSSENNPAPTAAATAAGKDYPAPSTGPTLDPNAPSPPPTEAPSGAYPGPSGAPAVDNQSKVTARLDSSAPDSEQAGYIKLHVTILASEDVNGLPNQTKGLVGQEVDLLIDAGSLPAIAPGESFTALVTMKGDEASKKFYATEVSK